MPEVPSFVLSTFKVLSRVFPRLSDANPDEALKRVGEELIEWFDWAKKYLDWYDLTYSDKSGPMKH
ncbi:MAG: hypothetical protein ACI89J_002265 [Hyphomicrobiaceae bacterium]